ncbi:E2F-associated phosphoprotein-domain-containing protein [Radiomyces spectabilis]|uniref:E2F-associated phosphoprotein-domain-containing protein n=1 Tax=Radiomyces spectabilis TaxID=64574 RepID=UPI00221E4EB5|nr:E2F-associated phosphoprotein-domain-containing protein [Radiomyces spectabilis]KAI8368211.1 E2F-associated phosphoprotein-domain-containing protein [Radiomyces spectabilis]
MQNDDTSSSTQYYDNLYFDSSAEEDEIDDSMETDAPRTKGAQKKADRRVLSNEELLYDPDLDEQDEDWVAKQILTAPLEKQSEDTAKTDAILTCPLCFSPLCFNCQRHDKYQNQYRAMFVTNCKVKKTERYRFGKPSKGQKGESTMVRSQEDDTADDDTEFYYSVHCDTCDTHVAMMDQDEVFHFFNVIPT